MIAESQVGYFLGVGGRTKDFSLVIAESLNPACDIAGMMRNVGWQSEDSSDEYGCQALLAIPPARRLPTPKPARKIAVEPFLMAGPMAELMQGNGRPFVRAPQRLLRGEAVYGR